VEQAVLEVLIVTMVGIALFAKDVLGLFTLMVGELAEIIVIEENKVALEEELHHGQEICVFLQQYPAFICKEIKAVLTTIFLLQVLAGEVEQDLLEEMLQLAELEAQAEMA